MGTRIQLHEKLLAMFGSNEVHFQPPPTKRMKYPAIVYSLNNIDSRHADNSTYLKYKQYMVTFIHKDPDLDLFDELTGAFPMCSFDRRYIADNLYHDVYTIYY